MECKGKGNILSEQNNQVKMIILTAIERLNLINIVFSLNLYCKSTKMNIAAEKEEIIRRFNLINDASLISAIKSLLDFGLSKQSNENSDLLEASIKRGIEQSNRREVRPHEEVWPEIRNRYKR